MLYDLIFNGYRLDHRSASKFDAAHASYKSAIVEGYYDLTTPTNDSLAGAFAPTSPHRSSRLGTEYELPSIPSNNMTPVRHYLFEGSSKARTGIQVDSSFFRAAQSFASGRSLDGLVLCVRYSAPWMRTALAEVGTREAPGKDANPRIMEYFKTAKFSTTDDSGKQNAWCASFVAWVMKQNGHAPPMLAFRALQWATFGRKIDAPVYGAIGVKSREGGGHVAFVVGKSADGKSLFMLGGNQDNRVSIARYARSVWTSFVVPDKFNSSGESLPIYTKPADSAGSEA